MTGAAGLIYQVVWFRVLMRVFGSTVYATSTLVASFMAGLALGAWLFGRIIDRRRAPLVWYAGLEFAIAGAVFGTLVTGIVLIGTFGENASVGCAVALNIIFYEDPVLRADMLEWDDLVDSAESLLGLYAADANRLASISEGYPIITDNYPWVEFPRFRYIAGGQRRFKKKYFVAVRDPIAPVLVTE